LAQACPEIKILALGFSTFEFFFPFQEESLRWPILTMEQLGLVEGNLALSFWLNFLSSFVHISGSNKPITVN